MSILQHRRTGVKRVGSPPTPKAPYQRASRFLCRRVWVSRLGGGGGAGGGDTDLFEYDGNDLADLVDAGGGGGGGGGGGIAGYGGGAGGNGGVLVFPGVPLGPAAYPGFPGSGPGHGLGGAGGASPSFNPGTMAGISSSAGGGGGGGGGEPNSGGGGTGGGGGAGGGGGGGAGDSSVDSSITHASFSTGPSGADGTVVISYTPPTSATPPVAPKLHLAVAGPRGVKPGHTAAYRITLRRTQPHNRRGYPVRNVHVVSTHAGHRVRPLAGAHAAPWAIAHPCG